MPNNETQAAILNLFSDFSGLEPLKTMFCEHLNYTYENQQLSRRDWKSNTARNALAEDPVMLASGGDEGAFHVIYARLDSNNLMLAKERPVVSALLRDYPYSLFVFSNKEQNRWHFVNVRVANKEDRKAKENKDPLRRRLFRRITVGPEEQMRTASERLAMLDLADISPDLSGLAPLVIQERHDEAFDVEAVTRAFYDGYKALFDILQTDLAKQTKDRVWAHDYVLQFLNRLMFMYFVQRKRWLNEDPHFIRTFWGAYQRSKQPEDSFACKWLNVMFFEAFNRGFHGGHHYFPEEISDVLQLAPYLNGGLFRENELDRKHSGCFTFRDKRFCQVFNFLEQYNFTISEDTPLDQEVAVDAEMLGKVYESLVNVSEEANERGDAGIFYTQRTEIDMMCRLALVDHLANHLGVEWKSLLYEAVFAYSTDEKDEADRHLSEKNLWPGLDHLLRNITIVDPACGSGSFLVGMLQVLDDLSQRADTILGRQETPYERRKRIIGQSLYGVDVMQWAVNVAELRLWLQLVIETELDPAELRFRPLLPHLTFKIRQGDSLVQEIGGINIAHLKSASAVSPALKGRITKLKGEKLKFYNNDQTSRYSSESEIRDEEFRLFRDILETREHDLSNQLNEALRSLGNKNIFGERTAVMEKSGQQKIEVRAETLKAELEQTTAALAVLHRVKTAPFVWDIAFVEIFDGERRGFDIVIGNPPYVRQEYISDPMLARDDVTTVKKKEYKNKLIHSVYELYPAFFGNNPEGSKHKLNAKSDLYIYFFFHGLALLNESGSFCFITSNSWLDVGYGKDLQEFLLTHSHVKMIIDNKAKRSFKAASVNTAIALLAPPVMNDGKAKKKTARFVMFTLSFDQVLSPVIFDEIDTATERKTTPEYRLFPIDQEKLFENGSDLPPEEENRKTTEQRSRNREHGPLIKVARYIGDKWGGKYLRAPDIYWTILEKGKGRLVRLGDVAKVRFGIKTGANEFFYLDQERIRQWGIEEEYLKPVIFSLKEIKCIRDDMVGLTRMKFDCHMEKSRILGSRAFDYIMWGESQGFHIRPTCKSRKLWYSIGDGWKPAPFVFPAKVGERMLVIDNIKGILEDKKLYGVSPSQGQKTFWGSILNCTLTRFFMDLTCRQLTGAQAIADIDVRIVENIPIISTGLINVAVMLPLYNAFSQRSIKSNIRDEYSQDDRKALDDIIFDKLGLTRFERDAVYEAIIELVSARLNKAKSL